MMEYIESGMDFSPLFAHDNSIYIEKSHFRNKKCKGVKTAEFITFLPNNKLYFIEAKASAPKGDSVEFYQDLIDKACNSLNMFLSMKLGINVDEDNEFPDNIANAVPNDCKLVFLLIVKNSNKDWNSEILIKLNNRLKDLRKIWKMNIVVWDNEQAQKKGFVKKPYEHTLEIGDN